MVKQRLIMQKLKADLKRYKEYTQDSKDDSEGFEKVVRYVEDLIEFIKLN